MTSVKMLPISVLLTLSLASGLAAASDEDPGVPSDWWSSVQQDIADSEYEISWQESTIPADLGAAWQAPNRAQGFRTYFTEEGIRVIPRTESEPSWEWGLSLIGVGPAGDVRPVEVATLEAEGNRVDYDRGDIVEWYVNDRRGLEQGFTISTPPDGDSGHPQVAALLHIDLALMGTLNPIISTDGQSIDFVTGEGVRVLRYAELWVTDATGHELAAWMEGFVVSGVRGIRLVVDDGDAVYPIAVDPLAKSPAWTAESDQAEAEFGVAAATAGDVNGDGYADVIVGAPWYDNGQANEGRAHVYHGSASGLASTPAWTAESNQVDGELGIAATTAGDVNGDGYSDVIIGAHLYNNGETDEGRAYVYHGSSTGLSATADWMVESNQANAALGRSVSAAGDVNGDGYGDVIVGASLYDNGQNDEGSAFVYHGSGSGLSATAAWKAECDLAGAWFGYSVATAGDVDGDGYGDVIIGANYYENIEYREGGAFVYHGSSTGLSTTSDWSAESDVATAQFGRALSTAGDVNGDGYADVIIGASGYDNIEANEGRAYVYHGSASGLLASPAWTVESDQVGAMLGHGVGTAGDVNGDGYADVVVGAPDYDCVETGEGRAWVYQGSSDGLSSTAAWEDGGGQEGARFGTRAFTAGDVNGDGYADVIVAAIRYDNGEADEGRTFVYHGSAGGLASVAGWTEEGDQMDAGFGGAVATAGDVNGDGLSDVIVGSWGFDNGEADEGRVLVYHGTPSGLGLVPSWTAEGDHAGANLGSSVGTAGDVNDDGYADVIVGASGYSNGETNEGRTFVYHGSASGLAAEASWFAEANQEWAAFGFSVATAGDVNGDGYADVIVGSFRYDNGETEEGRAWVYHGSSVGLTQIASWIAEGDQTDARLGASVSTAGDVNGDGYADVIVGAPFLDNGEPDEGSAQVYHGSATGLSLDADWTVEGDQADAELGFSVSTAGDVNGDGYADVIVGVPQAQSVRVYHGSATGLSPLADWTAVSDQTTAFFGDSVGTAGDVNGDGYADVVVGEPTYLVARLDQGRAFVYHGSLSGLSLTADWTDQSDQSGANFGYSVSTAGDVNGDGYAEVIVGAPWYDNGEPYEGRAYLYYGNQGPGLSLEPQQRRADDHDPIAPLGMSDSPDSYRLAALGRSPFGRGRARLEWETKPLGTLFDGAGTQTSATWTDSGISGAALDELVTGLTSGTHYHWRVRLVYDQASTPFQQTSRWLTVPRNGWEESDLLTRSLVDLVVRITDTPDPILRGGEITYLLDVRNEGPDDADDVSLRNQLPGDVTLVSATPSQGTCGESAGVVDCNLGTMPNGGRVTVELVVRADTAEVKINTASVISAGRDPDPSDDSDSEDTWVREPSIGDRVWDDVNGDGIQDGGEPGIVDVVVTLHGHAGTPLQTVYTDANGNYSFDPLTYGALYYVRFTPPEGYVLTIQDQGSDDMADSDADPVTWRTQTFSLVDGYDPDRWDAGMVVDCVVPDETVYIYSITLTPQDYPVLHFQDPNQAAHVTGYNIYRSHDAGLPPDQWPQIASDVVDMDAGEPNNQWVDTSGDVSPTGIWYYDVAAYNHRCPAEGPR
jgi:uncharacterized repeat protein (TIGR01451 family)